MYIFVFLKKILSLLVDLTEDEAAAVAADPDFLGSLFVADIYYARKDTGGKEDIGGSYRITRVGGE